MSTRKSRVTSSQRLRQRERQLRTLDATAKSSPKVREALVSDVRLARDNLLRQAAKTLARTPAGGSGRTGAAKRPGTKAGAGKGRPKTGSQATSTGKKPAAQSKNSSLSQLLSPKNLQESLKTVGNLRGTVKNWMRYLQQAEQMLDTFYVTSNSLKESGVLDKLVKYKGRNLTTEDFTSILVALMNSPIGGQIFKGSAAGDDSSGDSTEAQTAQTKPAGGQRQDGQPRQGQGGQSAQGGQSGQQGGGQGQGQGGQSGPYGAPNPYGPPGAWAQPGPYGAPNPYGPPGAWAQPGPYDPPSGQPPGYGQSSQQG